ncbi:hypothetical protein AB6A40_009434 [Gnathostoma spinigerum]|uniref:Catalase core domain-containing protein n=1 Tax=Gnathostoma spinigerum TaxID=75299 RepID=A0ABD6F1K7_9BILA
MLFSFFHQELIGTILQVWSHKTYPLIPVGTITLNRNPVNYFAEVEQAAFSPSHFVPGIEPSPDKMLQGRLFAYADTQFHRLGPNHVQLPINCPYRSKPHNTQRDGLMALDDNQGAAENYYPSSSGIFQERSDAIESIWSISGDVMRYDTGDEDNFSQPHDFWTKVLDEDARNRLIANIVSDLRKCKAEIQNRAVDMLEKIHNDLGEAVKQELNKALATNKDDKGRESSEIPEDVKADAETPTSTENMSEPTTKVDMTYRSSITLEIKPEESGEVVNSNEHFECRVEEVTDRSEPENNKKPKKKGKRCRIC